jgi:hypothetical protein
LRIDHSFFDLGSGDLFSECLLSGMQRNLAPVFPHSSFEQIQDEEQPYRTLMESKGRRNG